MTAATAATKAAKGAAQFYQAHNKTVARNVSVP